MMAGVRRDMGYRYLLPICEECQNTNKILIQECFNRLLLPI